MKMQSTEMEFVAFDAQDVIATSGGPNPYFSGDIMDYGTNKTFNDRLNTGDMNFFLYKGDQGNKGIYLKGSPIDRTGGTTYYILNSATFIQSGTTTAYFINATGTNDTPGGEQLESLGEILGWLTANANAQ